MPTLTTNHSPITPLSGGSDRVGQDSHSIQPEATNSARLNRSKITAEPGKPILRKAPPPPSPVPGTSVSERKSSVLPGNEVKTFISEARQPSADPLADKLEELARDVRQLRNQRPKASSKNSERGFKEQMSQLESSLNQAKKLQRGVTKAVWKVDREKTIEDLSFSRYEGSVSKSTTEKLSSEARQMVEELRQEVSEAKQLHKQFESRTRSTKRIHNAFNALKKGRAQFHELKPASPLNTTKDHSGHIRGLEKQLHHAKSVHSGAERLLRTALIASQQGLNLDELKSDTENIRTEASSEVERLKKEIAITRDSKKGASRREAKERAETKKAKRFAQAQKKTFEKMEKQAKREAKAEQRQIDQQLKNDAIQDAELQRKRGSKLTPTTEREVRKASVDSIKRERANRTKARAEARKTNTVSAVRQEQVHMPTFLAGIKGKRMSVDRLEDMIWSIRKPNDFKQAIANIQASGLDTNTQVRLRSLVSSALNGFVKNESNVRKIDNQFVAHVMYGDSTPEVLANYEKTVRRLAQRLER